MQFYDDFDLSHFTIFTELYRIMYKVYGERVSWKIKSVESKKWPQNPIKRVLFKTRWRHVLILQARKVFVSILSA